MHGLKSGKTLKVFRGHTSFVNALCVLADDATIVSGGSDAFVRVWDAKLAQCTTAFQLGEHEVKETAAIESVALLPRQTSAQLLVCNRSATLRVVTLGGALVRKYATDGATAGETFVAAVASPDAKFVYALSDKAQLYVFDTVSARLELKLAAFETSEPLALAHHPHQSMLAACARNDRELKLFQPLAE